MINDLDVLRRGLLCLPITWMALAPLLHTANRLPPAEVIAVAILAQPPPLAGSLARLSAGGLGTIPLTILRPWIRDE
jgi:hypothetical protein